MMCFETCTNCNMWHPDHMKPMVLCGQDKEMQCGVCGHSFKLPDCEAIVELARKQRDKKYGR
ncbi:hypothetical protein KAR91_66680 [Candidatus Pacearchaeota archaeon]|nr:hypothetical protein [Candidatus Pacearchaeota archaeon]